MAHHFLVMEERAAVTQCIDEQLTKIEGIIVTAGSVLTPLPLYRDKSQTFTLRIPIRSWTGSAWESVITEGLSAHLSASEREFLPVHYSQMEAAKERNDIEGDVVGKLSALSQPIELDPQVKAGFIEAIEMERFRNQSMGLLASQMMKRIRSLNYVPQMSERRAWLADSGALKFCREHGYTVQTSLSQ